MKNWRFGIDAQLCFSVEADTEEEARNKADVFLGSIIDGVSVETDDIADARVYHDDSFGASVELLDCEEESEAS